MPAPGKRPASAMPAPGKRRKGLLGAVVAQQGAVQCSRAAEPMSKIVLIVKAEVDQFEMITLKTLAEVRSSPTRNRIHCSRNLICISRVPPPQTTTPDRQTSPSPLLIRE